MGCGNLSRLQKDDPVQDGGTPVTTKTDPAMQDLKPTVWIGKQGCTEAAVEEIVAQLKKRKTIKIKWLQNTDVDPDAVAAAAHAALVEVRGRTMVLTESAK